MKIRSYDKSYIAYGFSYVLVNNVERPYCVLCQKYFANDSMRPAKLMEHLKKKHAEFVSKPPSFFVQKDASLREMKLTFEAKSPVIEKKFLKCSYIVAYNLAKVKKPHTIAENFFKPTMLKVVQELFGTDYESVAEKIPLSNSTIKRRIQKISEYLLENAIYDILHSDTGSFSIQLDESTDVASYAQLMVFARFLKNGIFKEVFLFCIPLELTTKANDIFAVVDRFFKKHGLDWKMLAGCCTDGAPAMLGNKSGLKALIKKQNNETIITHCIIHRQALAAKTISAELTKTLEQVIEIVNYIKNSALNTRIFAELCRDTDADFEKLVYHSSVRWLSKGNTLGRFFSLRKQIYQMLIDKNKDQLSNLLSNPEWMTQTAYLSDFFSRINELNLSLQGKGLNMFYYVDKLKAFLEKIDFWINCIQRRNFIIFENLYAIILEYDLPSILLNTLSENIINHLNTLQTELISYFSELTDKNINFCTHPFSFGFIFENHHDNEELIEFKNDSRMKILYETKDIENFWIEANQTYKNISKVPIKILHCFSSTYLCESAFSALLYIKNKNRSKLEVEDDLRCTLSEVEPDYDKLID